jgi:hypothetical protein
VRVPFVEHLTVPDAARIPHDAQQGSRLMAGGQTRRARLRARVRSLAYRARRKATKKFSDVELRQLRSLQKAYAGETGPDILVFGDSAMFWTLATDQDSRHMVEMIRDELGKDVTFEALVGPGYNPRIVTAFLSALESCPSRPKVVLVPTSVLMASTIWLQHPRLSYELVGQQVRTAVRDKAVRKLDRPDPDDFEEFDRLPAPSLYGARRTVGELRMIVNSKPETRWQKAVRTRHLMDYYNAERLEADSVGVTLVGDLAATLAEMRLPSVAYIAPINHEVLKTVLGAGAVEHMQRNAEVVETAYLKSAAGLGEVVNATMDNPGSDFSDPVHLNDHGRQVLARRIADVVRPLLDPKTGDAS